MALEAGEPVRLSLPSDSQVVLVGDRGTESSAALTSLRAGGTASVGFPVSLAMAHRHPAVVAGLGGRTLIVSKNSDATTYWTLRAAIVTASGDVEVSVQLPSSYPLFNADRLDATTDGAGGLIAAFPYYDVTASGSKDIGVFRLAARFQAVGRPARAADLRRVRSGGPATRTRRRGWGDHRVDGSARSGPGPPDRARDHVAARTGALLRPRPPGRRERARARHGAPVIRSNA